MLAEPPNLIELKPGDRIYKITNLNSYQSDYIGDYIESRKISKVTKNHVTAFHLYKGVEIETKIPKKKIGNEWLPVTPEIQELLKLQRLHLHLIYNLKNLQYNVRKLSEHDLYLLREIIERITK